MIAAGLLSNSLKRLVRVYYYLLAIVLLALISFSFVSNKTGPLISPEPYFAYVLKIGLFFLVALTIVAGSYLSNKMMKNFQTTTLLEEKAARYLRGQLYRTGLFSLAAIVVSVYFLLTADHNILLIKAIIILFMMVYKPSKLKARTDLSLTNQEYVELFGKD